MSLITTRDDWKENPTSKTEGATLEESEIKRRILAGEIGESDLSVKERDVYREQLKRARRY